MTLSGATLLFITFFFFKLNFFINFYEIILSYKDCGGLQN